MLRFDYAYLNTDYLLCADVITESLKVKREAQEDKRQAEETKQEPEMDPVTTAADGTVPQLGDGKLTDTDSSKDASLQGKSKRWHVYRITVLKYDYAYVYFI